MGKITRVEFLSRSSMTCTFSVLSLSRSLTTTLYRIVFPIFSRYYSSCKFFFFAFCWKTDGLEHTRLVIPSINFFFLLLFLFIDVAFLFPRSSAAFIQVLFCFVLFFLDFISSFIPSVEGSGNLSLSLLLPFKLFFFLGRIIYPYVYERL